MAFSNEKAYDSVKAGMAASFGIHNFPAMPAGLEVVSF